MEHLKSTLGYLIALFAFTLPFVTININSIIIIFMLLIALVILFIERDINHIKKQIVLFSPLFIYLLLLIIGISYSDDVSRSLTVIERNLSLIIFPTVFMAYPTGKIKPQIPLIFALGVLASLLYCNIYQYFNFGHPFKHSFTGLLKPIEIDPTYMSMYILFSLSIGITYLKRVDNRTKILICLAILYSILFLIKLGSKVALFTLFIVLVVSLFINLKGVKKGKLFLIAVAIVFGVLLVSYVTPLTYNRFYKPIINSGFDAYQLRISLLGERFYVWKCAVESLSNRAIFFGYGTGDEIEVLQSCYQKYRIKGYLNPHNIYFSTSLKVGLLGLFSMLSTVIYGLIKNGKQSPFIIFSVIILIMGLTESLFDRAKGILFFTMISTYFVSNLIRKNN